jgi:hypothetical protein
LLPQFHAIRRHKGGQQQEGMSEMERFLKKFWTQEDGNATLDWMVLTAGILLLGAAVIAFVSMPA